MQALKTPRFTRMWLRSIWIMLVVALATRSTADAVEPWADKNLKFTEGLVAWYDAGVEPAARAAAGKNRWKNGSRVDLWHDASGAGRNLRQPVTSDRPVIRFDDVQDELAFVHFDGDNDVLFAGDLNLSFNDVTVFVVGTPFTNDGGFRAFLSFNRDGQNDYVSGLNIDQGPGSSRKFAAINVEGPGFGGARNLKHDETPFGQLVRMCVASTPGAGGTALHVDGQPAEQRDRASGTIHLDRLTVGARFVHHGGAPQATGFLRGEIAEILIYDRRLSASEIDEVDRYLQRKYGDARMCPLPRDLLAARVIPKVEDPPPVQLFAPGFTARQLPVELPNLNNVRFRPDGKLLAVSYDGRIFLLSDTDGDGLEDHAEMFWDRPGFTVPVGMALTPPGYDRGDGVFIASRGQVVLVVDKDGDDRGDELIVVADGWTPIKQSTDALGVAVAPDGSIYFGTGTSDYTNGHLVDEKGQSHYVPGTVRGAIVRVSPDFKHYEPICSGIRFPVGLAFNRRGDLFCTDQEGATWLPNGNPFDELLHIQAGRHYGFPPRHPKHLPDVFDEPSVYDFAPQHQSTCGLCFNQPIVPGGQTFGPTWWQDNAFVCGYSRGKLFRTTLVKTDLGYVADADVLGCLNMLTIDSCLSPDGDLVVAVHSGGPDWGSGPSGQGKLYKLHYAEPQRPQPVRAWAASPHEVRIAFDRPLDAEEFRRYSNAMIESGAYVRAGDRFESLWPGYAVVERQMRTPRGVLPVLAANLTADRRSLILNTGAHAQAVGYAAIFPTANEMSSSPADALPQLPDVEVSYDLSGVEAEWRSADGKSDWQSWLPHVDLGAARGLIVGTAEADRLAEISSIPGTMTLRSQLDLSRMLRPAVQPGSTPDAEFPPENVTVVLTSAAPLTFVDGEKEHHSKPTIDGTHRLEWTKEEVSNDWIPVEIVLTTGGGDKVLSASWHTDEDPRPRAFQPRKFMLPWARRSDDTSGPMSAAQAELAGGDWHRGRELFYGEKAQCGKCHTVSGRGGWIGPDLSNLVHRDYTSVLRDITHPSFAINPDNQAYNVVLDDGRVLTGMVKPQGDLLRIGDAKGLETEVRRDSVEEMKPATISIMPEGIPKLLGENAMRDLLCFLLLAEPSDLKPAPIEQPGAPPARTRAEIGAVLRDAKPVDFEQLKPLEIVLVAGPKDHGPGEHDYPAWQARWTRLLNLAAAVTVETADPWPTPQQWETADVIVMFSANPAWAPARARELDAYFDRGGGLVLLHYAVNGQRAPEEYAERIGLAWNPDGSKYRHGELDLNLRMPQPHPITAGFTTLHFVDESYWQLIGDESRVQVLATQVEDGMPRPLLWTYRPGQGRVFACILGHYSWTFDDQLFRLLVLRGMAWTADQPVDRFNNLLLPGARVSDSAAASASDAGN